MSDLIHLLPDHIANQIAAGEVVQRPASIVKELLENAIDAGATELQFVYRDAGKELIQVVDNGCGMSPTDARMAFERHATSKIRNSDDLFAIQTMGFRGEALASIAAVAKVEVQTRRHNDELGTRILLEDGRVVTQEPCQCSAGTNFMVSHLFYNVPARRKFLKSDSVETRHMNDEFVRIALANPDLQFKAFHGTSEVFHLPAGKLSQRIAGVLGKVWRERIVPVEEETSQLRIRGYVGKPEFAKKRSGEQFFFVNGRFIQSRYLHHAVKMAYDRLIADDGWPMYVLFLTLDATQIDINVHPTKQEIKFEDERLVYQYLRVAVKHALGQFTVAPMIDFDAEADLTDMPAVPRRDHTTVTRILPSTISPAYEDSDAAAAGVAQGRTPGEDGFRQNDGRAPQAGRTPQAVAPGWRDLYAQAPIGGPRHNAQAQPAEHPYAAGGDTVTIGSDWREQDAAADELATTTETKPPYQLHNAYIVHQLKSGYVLVDQQGAHERILYERYLEQLTQPHRQATQAELFPTRLELPGAEAEALRALLPDLERLGFDIADLGADGFEVVGLPANLPGRQDARALVEALIGQHQDNFSVDLQVRERIAISLAQRSAVRRGVALPIEVQTQLVAQLFSTSHPEHTPAGHRCILTYDLVGIERAFGR